MNTRQRLLLAAFVSVALAALLLRSTDRKPASSQTGTGAAFPQPEQTPQSLSRQIADRLLASLRTETDPARREAAAHHAAQRIPRALLAAILAELEREDDRALAALASRALLLRWAWEEPTDAAAWTMQFAQGDLRRDALAAVGAGWAHQNPEALMTWSASLAPQERDWVLLHGASYLARTNLNLFSAWRDALAPSRESEQLGAQTAREWASRDPQAVVAAIRECARPEQAAWRQQLASGLAVQFAQAERCETAFAILDALPAGPEKQHVLKGTVIGWAQRDPVVVATWLENVADHPLRVEMSTLLAGTWLERDAPAAEKWATALPPGPLSDAVAERAAQYFATRDRAAAERWSLRIVADETRRQALAFVESSPAP